MMSEAEQRAGALRSALVIAAALAGCASDPITPAPIIRPGDGQGAGAAGTAAPQSPAHRLPQPRFVAAPSQECVPFARRVSGIDIRGDAYTWWAQAEGRFRRARAPSPGAVIVMEIRDDGTRGHVGVVKRVLGERLILIDHANWHGRGEVTVDVPVRDVSERGDWSQVNVWWLDQNTWGRKVYEVEGFILAR